MMEVFEKVFTLTVRVLTQTAEFFLLPLAKVEKVLHPDIEF